MVKYLKRIFFIFIIINIGSCIDSNSSQTDNSKIQKEEESKQEESSWVEDELKKQFYERTKKDSVDIFGLPIETLPDYFYNYPEIKYLRIDCTERNCITKLSSKISKLINLEVLILSKTSIKKLPKEIVQLKKLKVLRILGGGQLESLPNGIDELESLEVLDVWRNNLIELPETLIHLKKLKTLFLGENNFTEIYIKKTKVSLSNVHIKMDR